MPHLDRSSGSDGVGRQGCQVEATPNSGLSHHSLLFPISFPLTGLNPTISKRGPALDLRGREVMVSWA